MRRTLVLAFAVAALAALAAPLPVARAQMATCVDSTGMACITLVSTLGGAGAVTDDIFRTTDTPARYAPELHFATYMRGVNGCIGNTYDPTMLSGYMCHGAAPGEDIGMYANSLDWYWTQVARTDDSGASVADGAPGFYYPWRGRIMDLGGEANRVVLFPITDHGPLPCESFEYSVYLSNNPDATIEAPSTAPDAMQWNPAKLVRVFQQGWTRNPTATGAGDVAAHPSDLVAFLEDTSHGDAVADSLVTIWALPCGITFRYVAIVGGNYGNPGPECTYNSSEDELDAVAGLNEDGSSLCVDADGDGHRAVSCGGDDCDDTNPMVHPGAFEPCDATMDFDCLPMVACPAGTMCSHASGLCATACFEGNCGAGFTCASDNTCVEGSCAGVTCAAGMLCRGGTCVDACAGAVCPHGELCVSGACIDPCAGVVCPSNQVCIAARPGATQLCGPSCACMEAIIPCPGGTACDARTGMPAFGMCVDSGCETMTCGTDMVCVAGACVSSCAAVVCPGTELCRSGACVADRCASVMCGAGMVCTDGVCHDACDGVTCMTGMLCVSGSCVPDPCASTACASGSHCVGGACVPDATDAGVTGDGGHLNPDAGGGHMVAKAGCCRVAGVPGTSCGGPLALFGVAALAALRRRRRG